MFQSFSCCLDHTVTGHAWLAGNTSWDQDNLGALEGLLSLALAIALNLGIVSAILLLHPLIVSYGALGVDVGDIGGDTWSNRKRMH